MSGYNDLSDLDHDPQLAKALGDMVVAWAYAETSLCAAMARITGMNINMALMSYYQIPTFEARRKFIQSLIPEWKKSGKYDKAAIEKEIVGLKNLSLARNDWVHGVWCTDKKRTQTVIFDFRRPDENGRRKPVKAADVNNHVRAVVARAKKLAQLVEFTSMQGDN